MFVEFIEYDYGTRVSFNIHRICKIGVMKDKTIIWTDNGRDTYVRESYEEVIEKIRLLKF